MAKKKDINELTIDQLKTLEKDLLEEKRKLRFDMVVSTVENPSRIREVRREVARVKTLIREFELGKRKPKES